MVSTICTPQPPQSASRVLLVLLLGSHLGAYLHRKEEVAVAARSVHRQPQRGKMDGPARGAGFAGASLVDEEDAARPFLPEPLAL